MAFKRIMGLSLFIVGVAGWALGIYIHERVHLGKIEVQQTEESVEEGNSLFSVIPVTRPFAKAAIDSAREKIREGKKEIKEYGQWAYLLRTGGFLFTSLGGMVFAISFLKRQKKSR